LPCAMLMLARAVSGREVAKSALEES